MALTSSESGRVAGRGREDVGGGVNLPGGCGRVSGSPLCAGSRAAPIGCTAIGPSVGARGKKMHNLAWIAPLGHQSGVRCPSLCACVCVCGLTGGTTHTRPQLASFRVSACCETALC